MKIEIRKEIVFNLSENETETKYVCYLVATEQEDGIEFTVKLSDAEYNDIEKSIENTMLELNNLIAKREYIDIETSDLFVDEDEEVQYILEVPEPGEIL